MRRLMPGFSLAAVLIFGGMVGACQPTKPCHCVQSGGCRCPLLPPPKNTSALEQSGQTQTNKAHQSARHAREARAEYVAPRHEKRFAPHRGHHGEVGHTRRHQAGTEPQGSAKEHESWIARPGRHLHRTYEAPSSRSGGALSYDSASRSNRLGAYSPPRGRFALREREREGFEDDRFHDNAHRHDAEREYDERRFEPARMSINSPEALEPWRGYGIECPDRRE
jgi:hypothetical protein